MNCPFCNDANIRSRLVYKNALVMAFLNNMPIVPGHTLICPIRHVAKIDQLSGEELNAVKYFIIRLKNSLKKSLNAEGFNIAWNEGQKAGQSIKHLHIHVLPRKTGDAGIYEYEPRKFLYRPENREKSPGQELQEISKLIKKNF